MSALPNHSDLDHITVPSASGLAKTPEQVIYDVDDDNALVDIEAGVPHADSPFVPASTMTFAVGHSAIVHNPYRCFGGVANVWPRGFPLDAINDENSTRCNTVSVGSSMAEGGHEERLLLGVIQGLANHDPDVDAIYRLTHPPGGLPFNFVAAASTTPEGESALKIVPPSAFTPYNAQVYTPTIPYIAHGVQLEYEHCGIDAGDGLSLLKMHDRFRRL